MGRRGTRSVLQTAQGVVTKMDHVLQLKDVEKASIDRSFSINFDLFLSYSQALPHLDSTQLNLYPTLERPS
jgi:hypothetical protein